MVLKLIFPYSGFWQQLKLYEQMNYKIDLDFKPYKMFKLLMDCQKITESHYVHESVSQAQVLQSNVKSTYKCKKCRKTLATDLNVFNHSPMESEIHLSFETFQEPKNCCRNGIFLENMDWMKSSNNLISDKLSCDKCGSKIGSYSWTKKVTCPCGSSMIPGFFINMKRIDVSNLYVTM